MEKGKIHTGVREYVVKCAKCEEEQANHVYSQRQFAKSILNGGWRKVNGLWYCGSCAIRLGRELAEGKIE